MVISALKLALAAELRYLKVRFPRYPDWRVSAIGKKDYLSVVDIRLAQALALLRGLI